MIQTKIKLNYLISLKSIVVIMSFAEKATCFHLCKINTPQQLKSIKRNHNENINVNTQVSKLINILRYHSLLLEKIDLSLKSNL